MAGSPRAEGSGPGTRQIESGATALIVAAGSGQRLGAGGPKALVTLGGRPMYEWAVSAFSAAESIDRIVVAVPPGAQSGFSSQGIELVEGADTRSGSVAAGLARVDTEYVVVHDAARPLVTPELIDRAVSMLASKPDLDAVIAAVPVTDTVKRVDPAGLVLGTLDRDELRSVQTPQVFRSAALRAAIDSGDLEKATDDAFLIESAGGQVAVLDAPATNIKVTVVADIALAELLLSGNADHSNPSSPEVQN